MGNNERFIDDPSFSIATIPSEPVLVSSSFGTSSSSELVKFDEPESTLRDVATREHDDLTTSCRSIEGKSSCAVA